MPYKEIGTPVNFVNYSIVPASEYLVAGSAGLYGLQSVEGRTNVNIDLIDLSAVKASLESSGKITVNYVRMSWNQIEPPIWPYGVKITDFVFAFSFTLKAVVTVNELWVFLPAQLQQVINDLGMAARGDFTVYMLGIRQSDYTYTWDYEGLSSNYMIPLGQVPPSDQELSNLLVSSGLIDLVHNTLKNESANQNAVITIRGYRILQAHAEWVGAVPNVGATFRTRIKLSTDFDSDTPVNASPLAPWMILVLYLVVIAIAGFVAYTFVNNITKQTETFKTRITNNTDQTVRVRTPYGDVDIPPYSTLDFEEKIEGPPDWWAWVVPAVALIVVGAGALVIVPRLLPPPRRSREE